MPPVKAFTMLTVLFLITERSILGKAATRRANYLDLKYGKVVYRPREEIMVVTLVPRFGKPMVIVYPGVTGEPQAFTYYLKEAILAAASLQRYTPDSAQDALSA